MITATDILTSDGQHVDRLAVANAGVIVAAKDLADRLNKLFAIDGCPPRPTINSGYRTPAANAAAGGAKNSSHLYGMAVDFHDPEHLLGGWCLANTGELSAVGLWAEALQYTPTWLHLQSRPVGGTVFFNP